MKKSNLLFLAIALITMTLASCGHSYKVKDVSLKTQEDSLNYYLGYLNGSGIKEQFLANDSSDKAIENFMVKLDKAFKTKDEIKQFGIQLGRNLKNQEKAGVFGDSTLILNTDLIKQGIVNGLKDYKEGMNSDEANQYFQTTMQKIQEEKMKKEMPQVPDTLQNVPGATK
ncbi:MAG: hypothetical protein ACK5L7_10265 [Paludibacteraceae bacterium]